MDRFVKNVLLLSFLLTFLILCSSYIGSALFGQQFEGTDEKIQSAAAPISESPTSLTSVNHQIEPILYGVLGTAGGFVSGFFYVDVFYRGVNNHG